MLALLALSAASPARADQDVLAGFSPNTDVTQHSRIDLDQKNMETALAADDFMTAYRWYSVGGNSVKGSGANRTIQGFSTGAVPKMVGSKWMEVYARYHGTQGAPMYNYADVFTSDACLGQGQFAGVDQVAKKELCKKGSAYQNVWMYVVWEMQDAIDDCLGGDLSNNGAAVHAWDEAVAFYVGSLEGTDGSGAGVLGYALAEKRAPQFGTANSDGSAIVNAEVMDLFKDGQSKLLAGKCAEVETVRDKIVAQITVPLVQGALRYALLTDPAGPIRQGAKGQAEGWAFAIAVLPQINRCNPTVAAEIRENLQYPNPQGPMVDGYRYVKQQFESVYSCMGITCDSVGGLLNGNEGYFDGMEPCRDPSSSSSSNNDDDDDKLSGGAVAGIVIAVFVVLAALGGAAFWCGRRHEKHQTLLDQPKGKAVGGSSVMEEQKAQSAV
uniref:Chitosanase n=1 Tax=Lotharella oceanica TaxID=641309 RepID=A0A7S2XA87_9EUKA|mmetsp:Transcript_17858/g.33831  ORF Transcript_17858/g.33831 Transcript_17858/m.33831 type:complete len:440 (+) Transcript_17858:171-1490(+)